MSLQLTVTAKGQVTLRQSVLEHLSVKPGQKVGVALLPNGRVELRALDDQPEIGVARGILRRSGQRPVTIDEMQDAIETSQPR